MATDLPPSLRESWQSLGTKTTEGRVMMLSVTTETTVYAQRGTADTTEIDGASDIPLRSLFTIDVSFSPPLATVGVTPKAVFSMAAPKATTRFLDQIEAYGLQIGDERKTSTYERPDGTTGRWTVVSAAYPIGGANEESDEANAGAKPKPKADNPTIPVETHIGIWPTRTAYGMAGGTVPLEVPESVSLQTGFEVDIDPDPDRQVIAELMHRTGLEDEPETLGDRSN